MARLRALIVEEALCQTFCPKASSAGLKSPGYVMEMTVCKNTFITCPSGCNDASGPKEAVVVSVPVIQSSLALLSCKQPLWASDTESTSPARTSFLAPTGAHFWKHLSLLFPPSWVIFLQLLPCATLPGTCAHSDPGLSAQKDKDWWDPQVALHPHTYKL